MRVDARPPDATRSVYVRPSERSARVWPRPSREASVNSTGTNAGIVTAGGWTRFGRVNMKVAGTRIGSDGVVPAFASVAAPGGGAVPWTFAGLVGAVWGAAVAAGGAVETLDTDLTVPDPSPPHPETVRTTTVAVNPPIGAPTASAGAPQTVASAAPVTLIGTASDPNNPPKSLTYAWTQTSGAAVTRSFQETIDHWHGVYSEMRLVRDPVIDEAYRWVRDREPEPVPACLVHGDYRIGNCLTDGCTLRRS